MMMTTLNKVDAVIEAAAIRLRPIIMTSLALIFAMVPLLIAIGPGAESRFAIGLTISAGLGIGTLFTVFVLPAIACSTSSCSRAESPRARRGRRRRKRGGRRPRRPESR